MLGGEEDKDRPPILDNRRAYSRSISWTERSPTKLNTRQQQQQPNNKARGCLPPLQPLSVSRPKAEEWPRAGSDDLGVWPNHPPTPGVRLEPVKLFPNGDSEKPPRGTREFEFEKDKLAFFDKECSRIADHVYLGSDAVAKNREILQRNGITHVLNCVGFVCPEYFKNDLVYKTLWLRDSSSEDITSILYDVFDYFEEVREQGGRVLVHCSQGVSRSTSLVIAYLMWKEGQNYEDALEYVKAARGVTNPNMGFACQLLQCQKRVHAVPASPNSVLRMYRMAPHSSYDPLHLVPKMLIQPSAQALDSRGAFIIHVPSAIYVWVGKSCIPVMSDNARAAALQVIRYERAQGQLLIVKEGEEPFDFWIALANGQVLPDTYSKAETLDEERLPAAIHPGVGQRKVDNYDMDFEIFHKALDGGVVPPFPLSGTGLETCLPARENGWGRLRKKFVSGIMREFITSSKLSGDAAQSSHRPDMPMDILEEVESPVSPNASFGSTPGCDSPGSFSSYVTGGPSWVKDTCTKMEKSVPLTDPTLSPSTPRSPPDSFSHFLLKNPKFSSSSPLLSPSTSDYSNSFTFSPSSSSWSDLSYPSAQPSPSGLESTDLYPAKNGSLVERACLRCKESYPYPENPFSANHAFRNSCFPCRGTSPSIAERRGSNPPPRMMLPSVDDTAHVPSELVRSSSFSLPNLEAGVVSEVECNQFERGVLGMNGEELMLDADIFPAADEFQNEMQVEDDYETSHVPSRDAIDRIAEGTSFVLYQWPNMDQVEMHCFDILDSRSVYVMFVPDATLATQRPAILYVWVGSGVSGEKSQTQLNSSDHTPKDNLLQWEIVGRNFLLEKGSCNKLFCSDSQRR